MATRSVLYLSFVHDVIIISDVSPTYDPIRAMRTTNYYMKGKYDSEGTPHVVAAAASVVIHRAVAPTALRVAWYV
jgi:hypothetical protein